MKNSKFISDLIEKIGNELLEMTPEERRKFLNSGTGEFAAIIDQAGFLSKKKENLVFLIFQLLISISTVMNKFKT